MAQLSQAQLDGQRLYQASHGSFSAAAGVIAFPSVEVHGREGSDRVSTRPIYCRGLCGAQVSPGALSVSSNIARDGEVVAAASPPVQAKETHCCDGKAVVRLSSTQGGVGTLARVRLRQHM